MEVPLSVKELDALINKYSGQLKKLREINGNNITFRFSDKQVTIVSQFASEYKGHISFQGLSLRNVHFDIIKKLFIDPEVPFKQYRFHDYHKVLRFFSVVYQAANTIAEKDRIKRYYDDFNQHGKPIANCYYDDIPWTSDIDHTLDYIAKFKKQEQIDTYAPLAKVLGKIRETILAGDDPRPLNDLKKREFDRLLGTYLRCIISIE